MPRPAAPAAIPFLGVGIVFTTLGASGHRPAFFSVGIALLVLGFVLFVRRRKTN